MRLEPAIGPSGAIPAAPASREGGTRGADGGLLAWTAWGEPGLPRLLLLHGSGRRAAQYTTLARALAGRFQVFVMDRRGRGRSAALPPEPSLAGELDDIRRVWDDVGATHIFAHSAGARYALELSRERPPETLSLYEPPFSVPGGWEDDFVAAVEGGRRGEAMRRLVLGMQMGPKGRWSDRVLEVGGWIMLQGPTGEDTWSLFKTLPHELAVARELDRDPGRYAGIVAPTLLLGGTASPEYLRTSLAELQVSIPGAHRVMLAGQAHNAPEQSGPHEVASAILHFVGGFVA